MGLAASCASCGKPQPPDWKAGDLCVHCGTASRADLRCFWCVQWTPPVKFCRGCGAETVDLRLFGAARMLKDAGTDRFSVPKLLREMDADQVENFTRLYQRHEAVVRRHADELRFLESRLPLGGWSGPFEDALVAELPWPKEKLAQLDTPPADLAGDAVAASRSIQKASPFGHTRSVAAVVRLLLDDFEAARDVSGLLGVQDPVLRQSAALALTGWRVRAAVGEISNRSQLLQALRSCTLQPATRVRLALFDPKLELPREDLDAADPDVAFQAALILGDGDRLRSALRKDDLARSVAGRRLVQLGEYGGLDRLWPSSSPEVRLAWVEALDQSKGELPGSLLEELLATATQASTPERLRERCVRVLAKRGPAEWTVRLARAADGDHHIYQSLLQRPNAEPGSLDGLADLLVEAGRFVSTQYGLQDALRSGAISDRFAPSRFTQASVDTRAELVRAAEIQFKERGDEELHRFLVRTFLGPHPAEIRSAAWWALSRTYRAGGEHRGEGPLRLDLASGERFFGSMDGLLRGVASVLRDRPSRDEVGIFDKLTDLFREADAAAVLSAPDAAADLVRAACDGLRAGLKSQLPDAVVGFLGKVGGHPEWRDEVLRTLQGLDAKGGYTWTTAVRRLSLAALDLPDEPEWGKCPATFVPSRWAGAGPEVRAKLLEIAEAQFRSGPQPILSSWLLARGLRDRDSSLLALRARRDPPHLKLDPGLLERHVGPVDEFLGVVGDALLDPAFGSTAEVWNLAEELIRHVSDDGIEFLKGAAPGIARFVDALEVLSTRERPDARLADLRYAAKDLVRKARPAPPPAPKEAPPPGATPAPDPGPTEVQDQVQAAIQDQNRKAFEMQRLSVELQTAIMTLMAGPADPAEKTREAMRLQAEFQEKIRRLYA